MRSSATNCCTSRVYLDSCFGSHTINSWYCGNVLGDVSHVGASLLVLSASLVVDTPRAVGGAIEVMEGVVSCGHGCKREVASRTRYHVVFRGLNEERGVRGGHHNWFDNSDSRDKLLK